MDGWLAGWLADWIAGWMGGGVDGWMDGWTDGRMDGWTDGWMAQCILAVLYVLLLSNTSDTLRSSINRRCWLDQ